MFILPFFRVSRQPPNIQRSSSDFFYPKSLIRRTGRSPSLQVGAVSRPGLGAAVPAPGLCRFSPLCCSVHLTAPAPAEADAFSHPTECLSHSDFGCFPPRSMFSCRAVAKASTLEATLWSCVFTCLFVEQIFAVAQL